MCDFHTNSVHSNIMTSHSSQSLEDLIKILNIIEADISRLKNLVENEVYYKDIIEDIVHIQSRLFLTAYILLEENMKKSIAERIQGGNTEGLDKILITTGKLIKM